jgi:hypothetical protein
MKCLASCLRKGSSKEDTQIIRSPREEDFNQVDISNKYSIIHRFTTSQASLFSILQQTIVDWLYTPHGRTINTCIHACHADLIYLKTTLHPTPPSQPWKEKSPPTQLPCPDTMKRKKALSRTCVCMCGVSVQYKGSAKRTSVLEWAKYNVCASMPFLQDPTWTFLSNAK